MKNTIYGEQFLKELEMEVGATRKCLERIPEGLFDWKPHPKSMQMGYLALLVADIPKWITSMIEVKEIDLKTWGGYTKEKFADLVKSFDEHIAGAKNALKNATDEELEKGMFVLKMGEQEIMKTSMIESITSALNHWVHHRGQLTVYMRLNDIDVPSIYGPSADEKMF
jgi:uncharacterized damage-inducible protein DinB